MRIGVVSDTHLPRFGRRLPVALEAGLAEARVELILHLGDFTESLAADLLEAIAPLEGVAGNNDGPDLVARFGRQRILDLDGVRIGLVHGDRGTGANAVERARRALPAEPLDALLFGHSHAQHHESVATRSGERLLLNPGSPTARRRGGATLGYALLEIAEGRLRAELRTFDDRHAG